MKRQTIRKATILISFLLFPLTIFYFSPFLIILGASEGIITGSFIIFSLMFLTSLFFGRAYCGWVCPGAGLQESCMLVNGKNNKGGWRKWIKYLIWIPWVLIIATVLISSGRVISIDFLYQTWYGISMHNPFEWIIYYSVILLIVVLSFVGGKRSFCHSACWMAPFMVIGQYLRRILKIPGLRLKTEPEKCIGCHLCTKKCPMSLNVLELVKKGSITDIDCILCGECVDVCPKHVIHFTWKQD
jgi:ferredoxin-type protein NapH